MCMSKNEYRCPCCRTLVEEEHDTDICQECKWHDDGVKDLDEWCYCNGNTLREARANYAKYGACDPHGYWCKHYKYLSEETTN
jgi:hypothetical protein